MFLLESKCNPLFVCVSFGSSRGFWWSCLNVFCPFNRAAACGFLHPFVTELVNWFRTPLQAGIFCSSNDFCPLCLLLISAHLLQAAVPSLPSIGAPTASNGKRSLPLCSADTPRGYVCLVGTREMGGSCNVMWLGVVSLCSMALLTLEHPHACSSVVLAMPFLQ